jgi:hypothetical protein
MKKQVIAAAVASTLSVAALADISITGQMKSNYTHTDYDSSMVNDSDIIKTEGDLYVKGSNGDTSVVMNFSIADHITADNSVSTNNAIEDAYMTTKIGDVSLKVGQWDNGNNAMRASTRKAGKLEASTEMGGVGIKFATTNESDDELTLSTSIGGVSASFKQKNAGEDYAVSGTVAGINASYSVIGSDTANSDKSYVELSTSLGGVGVKYGKAEADSAVCLDGDTWLGDFEDTSNFTCHTTYNNGDSVWQLNKGQDLTGLELSTSLQGNAVKFRTVSSDDLAGADTTYNKVIVTRPLASGTTFELTYTDVSDDAEVTTDYNSLDLELAVKF